MHISDVRAREGQNRTTTTVVRPRVGLSELVIDANDVLIVVLHERRGCQCCADVDERLLIGTCRNSRSQCAANNKVGTGIVRKHERVRNVIANPDLTIGRSIEFRSSALKNTQRLFDPDMLVLECGLY